jgi:hypothetical protein
MTNNKLKQMRVKEEKDEVNSNDHHKSTGITEKQQEHMKHNQHQQQNHHQDPLSNKYSVDLHFDSIVPEAGRKTMLNISVTEQLGIPVREFEFIHDKLMHLMKR